MAAIDWGKRIVGIMGSPGNLLRASLLQNGGSIHHSGDGVGAVCEVGDGTQKRFIWSIWFIQFISFSEPDKPNKLNRPDEPDRPAP
jgi:hypothetical protein